MANTRNLGEVNSHTLTTAVRRVLYTRAPLPAVLALTSVALMSGPAIADQLDEVVVTATRRNATTEDIPYSISAISEKTLEDNHVTSLADLTKQIAGLAFCDQGPLSRSNIVLRGINANGTDHPSVTTVPPVSTYIGETPLFIPLQIDDLNRVEVLRGPQGTLYGSGSLAGTLRFIPNKPDLSGVHGDIEADGSQVEVGHDFNDRFTGMLNLPLASTVAFRVSAGYQHYAGFIDEKYIVKLGAPSTAKNSPVGVPVSADPNNILGPMVFTPKDNANDSNQSHVRAALLSSRRRASRHCSLTIIKTTFSTGFRRSHQISGATSIRHRRKTPFIAPLIRCLFRRAARCSRTTRPTTPTTVFSCRPSAILILRAST